LRRQSERVVFFIGEENILNWLKEKKTKAAVNQCKYNIKLNVQTLVSIANETSAHINETDSFNDADNKRVFSAQKSLKDDVLLGIANELTIQDIREVIKDAINELEVSEGAEMAIEHVLESSETEWKRLKE